LNDLRMSDCGLRRDGGVYEGAGLIGRVAYPFFFYQIPELVPNLVIALGISPPNGIMRHWYRLTVYAGMVAAYHARCLLCCCACAAGGSYDRSGLFYPQQSVFDGVNAGTGSDHGGGSMSQHSTVIGSAAEPTPPPNTLSGQSVESSSKPCFVGEASAADEETGGVVSPVHRAASRTQEMRISLASSNGDDQVTAAGKSSFHVARGSALSTDDEPNHGTNGPHSGGSFLSTMSASLSQPVAAARSTGSLSGRSTGSKSARSSGE
jgi:hypothetical protein